MKKMRRVLLLAYHFPPVGGGGVQRSIKFVRDLPSFGYEPIVVTGTGRSADTWTPRDDALASQVASTVDVVRVAGDEPPLSVPGWRGRVGRVLDRPSDFTKWWIEGAYQAGLEAAGGADVILAELVPYTTAYAAARLSAELGVPWVADLQDPWALDEVWLYASGLHLRRDADRMRRLLGTASAIIMNTPEARSRVERSFPELEPRLAPAITNGYALEDFDGPEPERDHSKFRIVHTGHLHTEAGYALRRSRRRRHLLGGMPYPEIDLVPRSHVFLLEAVERIVRAEPALRNVIEVHLAGVTSALDREIAARSGVCKVHGYVAHARAIELLRTGDLLFLPMHDLPRGTRAGLIPGKTFDYLAARRPILAAVPEGDARDLLAAAGNAAICWPTDVDGMERAIRCNLERWQTRTQKSEPDPALVAQFEGRALAAKLAAVLDGMVESPPPAAFTGRLAALRPGR